MGEVLAFWAQETHAKKEKLLQQQKRNKSTKLSWRFLSPIDLQSSQVQNFTVFNPTPEEVQWGWDISQLNPTNMTSYTRPRGVWICYFLLSIHDHLVLREFTCQVFSNCHLFFFFSFPRTFFSTFILCPKDKILQWDRTTYRESRSSSQKSTLKFLSGVHLASSAPVALRKSSRLSSKEGKGREGKGGGGHEKIVHSVNGLL